MTRIDFVSANPSAGGLCIALGMFDGVHLGHRRILAAAKRKSTELGLRAAVLIFSSSPHGAPAIYSLDDRLRIFRGLGMETALIYDFDELRFCLAEDFVRRVLFETWHARAVFAGYNYRFGTEAKGDAARLSELCALYGIFCDVAGEVETSGVAVSSTRIRNLLSAGRIEEANALLASPYHLTAPVLHGKALGRTIGLPTINQSFGSSRLIPKRGIYFTKTLVGGKAYPSVSNIGVRPTVEQGADVNLETNLIDFSGDLYGRTVTVEFYHFRREERRFDTVKELTGTIRADRAAAAAYFEAREGDQ